MLQRHNGPGGRGSTSPNPLASTFTRKNLFSIFLLQWSVLLLKNFFSDSVAENPIFQTHQIFLTHQKHFSDSNFSDPSKINFFLHLTFTGSSGRGSSPTYSFSVFFFNNKIFHFFSHQTRNGSGGRGSFSIDLVAIFFFDFSYFLPKA